MTVVDWPSDTVELIWSIPARLRTAASILSVTWFSSSLGAAPGWLTETITTGKSMSGLSLTCIRAKLTMPATVSIANSTSAGIGLRIDQAEMLRKLTGGTTS